MPKTFNNLFEQIVSLGNLFMAARKAALGKRHKGYVDAFRLDLEHEIWALREELLSGAYQPGPYRVFRISDPKPRLISAAPFRDRVVHHALCNVIEPLWERRFVSESFANRRGLGTSAARDHFAMGIQCFPYVLCVDFCKFFPSIDHAMIKRQFRRVIRCRRTLWLLDLIVDASNPQEPAEWYFPGDDLWTPFNRRRGIPLGNQTSQFFANVYLDSLDHFVKEQLRCPHYVRYVDDLALFGRTKEELRHWREAIELRAAMMRLKVHPAKTRIFRCNEGVTFLGLRFWPGRRRLAAENVNRVRRRIKKLMILWSRGEMTREKLVGSWRGWMGHAMQAQSAGLAASLREYAYSIWAGSKSGVPCR